MKKYHHDLKKHLRELYKADLRRDTPTRPAFLSWQRRMRGRLKELLAVPTVRVVGTKKVRKWHINGIQLSLVDLLLSDGTRMRLYRGAPREARGTTRPLMIYHGHADGAQTLFGIGMTKPRQDYGVEFIRQGYTVYAPDMRGFGKRLGPAPINYAGYVRSCRQLSFDLQLLGRSLLGERVGDALALRTWLAKKYPGTPLFVTGNSGGGTLALLHAALDTGVAGALVSGAFCSYETSIMAIAHCECNYVPSILPRIGEIWSVGALIAPRPLLIIHGKEDHIFPIAGVRRAVREVRLRYRQMGAERLVRLHEHNGGHWYDHAAAFSFLEANKKV